METLNDIKWKEIITEIVLPHLGTLTLYIVGFCVIGFVLGLIYTILLWKKNIFVRQQKHYNWFVKLYVPALIFVFLYFAVNFAFIFGAKSIIKDEESKVVSEIYETSIKLAFENPEERKAFIQKLQIGSAEFQKLGKEISDDVIKQVSENNSGIGFIDSGKNKLTNFIVNKYQTNLYAATLYGLNVAAGTQMKTSEMTLEEVNTLVNVLNTLEPAKIETSVKSKLTEMVDKIITSQINGFAKTTLYIFLLLIFIPVLEWLIYGWYLKRKADKLIIVDRKL
jgi:hypothetical protein